jgi:hypothetical protein
MSSGRITYIDSKEACHSFCVSLVPPHTTTGVHVCYRCVRGIHANIASLTLQRALPILVL